MKRVLFVSILSITLCAVYPSQATIGYVNESFSPGYTLFQNPLLGSDNHLSVLFAPTTPPGTTITLWNPAMNAYDQSSVYEEGVWSQDFELMPGTGARLKTSSAFANTFAGTVLNPDGTSASPYGPWPNPSPFAGPDGIYLLGCKTPFGPDILSGSEVWMRVLGREPRVGEQLVRWDGATQSPLPTATYLGDGEWDNNPQLNVGEAAFFVVPEPSVLVLGLVGAGILVVRLTHRTGRTPRGATVEA